MFTVDILLNVANVLYAGALFVRDMLWLRSLIFLSGAVLVYWGFLKHDYIYIYWTFFFLAINGVNIVHILLERRRVTLSVEMESIYEAIFRDLNRRDFLNFWNFGTERKIASGDLICREGSVPEDLLFIIEGNAEVLKEEHEVAILGSHSFIAEMSFLTSQRATADVRAEEPMRIQAWSQQKLRDLVQVKPDLLSTLRSILGQDLSRKLKLERQA